MNLDVDGFNSRILEKIDGTAKVYYSYDRIKETEGEAIGIREDAITDYLSLVRGNRIPSHELHLKKGAVCTIMRNLSVERGLVKNARVIVQEMLQHSVQVRSQLSVESNHLY